MGGMSGEGWRVAGKWNGKESGWGGRWEGGSGDAEKRERERGGERERRERFNINFFFNFLIFKNIFNSFLIQLD